jgi:hypothetical protein
MVAPILPAHHVTRTHLSESPSTLGKGNQLVLHNTPGIPLSDTKYSSRNRTRSPLCYPSFYGLSSNRAQEYNVEPGVVVKSSDVGASPDADLFPDGHAAEFYAMLRHSHSGQHAPSIDRASLPI